MQVGTFTALLVGGIPANSPMCLPTKFNSNRAFFSVIIVVVKLGLRYLDATTDYHWPYQFIQITRFDCMAIGAMGAILYFEKNKSMPGTKR